MGQASPTPTGTPTPTPTATPTFLPPPPAGGYAYVTNAGSDAMPGTTVSRINLSTYEVDRTISVGLRPMGVDITPDGTWLYVVNNDSDTVSVVHTGDAREVMQIPVGVEPLGIAIDHGGRYAYVGNSTDTPETTDGTVSVIDIASNTVIGEIPVGKFPGWGIAVSNDDTKLAVANLYDDTIYLIDTATRTVISVISRADGFIPMDVRFGPGDQRLYVAYFSDGTYDHVRSMDIAGGGPDLYYDTEGEGPASVLFHPGGAWFVASNYIGNNIFNRNLGTGVEGAVDVATGPLRGGFTPDGGRLVVPCYRSSQDIHVGIVEVLDCSGGTPVPLRTMSVGINPAAVVISNQALGQYAGRNAPEINLFAGPKTAKSGDSISMNYAIVLPAGLSGVDADVTVGAIVNDARIYAFREGFKGVAEVRDVRSIPKTIRGARLVNGQSGYLRFSGLPSGVSIKFFLALSDPKRGTVTYSAFANRVTIE